MSSLQVFLLGAIIGQLAMVVWLLLAYGVVRVVKRERSRG